MRDRTSFSEFQVKVCAFVSLMIWWSGVNFGDYSNRKRWFESNKRINSLVGMRHRLFLASILCVFCRWATVFMLRKSHACVTLKWFFLCYFAGFVSFFNKTICETMFLAIRSVVKWSKILLMEYLSVEIKTFICLVLCKLFSLSTNWIFNAMSESSTLEHSMGFVTESTESISISRYCA